jgi:hypothetical protein
MLAGDSWGPADGPLVLLQHGGGQTRHAWKSAGEALGRARYHAIAFDARGHGDSDWAPDGVYGQDIMVDPDDKWGEAVKAVVIVQRGAEVPAEELMALVRDKKGPVYAPKSVDFVEQIPLTAVGKADKKALRTPYWAGMEHQVH